MTSEINLVDSNEVKQTKKKSPAQVMVEKLPEGLLTTKDLAARYGTHIETIRRIVKKRDADGIPLVNAPSKAMTQGKLTIWVYTPEDVAEMDAYMAGRGYFPNGDPVQDLDPDMVKEPLDE